MNDIQLDIQIACEATNIPSKAKLIKWTKSALQDVAKAEITIRIVDEQESAHLNQVYRNKKGPTNVLSFPFNNPVFSDCLLGDIVICAPIVEKEAKAQNKKAEAHWAHLIIHGILHLQGYDHIIDEDAVKMESLETSILDQLGFPDPYQQIS